MEHKMKCNVCGKIFCYTDEDLQQNLKNAGLSALGAIGSLASTLGGGTIFHTQYLTGQSDRYSDKIVDYDQCPYCHSRDLSPYTGEAQNSESPATAAEIPQKTISINSSAAPESLLKRAFLFLEDCDWVTADAYCDACLDKAPELAEAYLGKLMAELHISKQELLVNCENPFYNSNNYQKVLRFAEPMLAEKLKGYNAQIEQRNEQARLAELYNSAIKQVNAAKSGDDFKHAADAFMRISGFQDADDKRAYCQEKAEKSWEREKIELQERQRLNKIAQEEAAKQKEEYDKKIDKKSKSSQSLLLWQSLSS